MVDNIKYPHSTSKLKKIKTWDRHQWLALVKKVMIFDFHKRRGIS
jgi:hypothetical protein